MRFCAMKSCGNVSKTNNVSNGGVSYHKFPKNSTVKKQWVKATGRELWRPSRYSFICSKHFDEKKVHVSKKGYKYLSAKAIPIQNQNEKGEVPAVYSGRPQNEVIKEQGVQTVNSEPSKNGKKEAVEPAENSKPDEKRGKTRNSSKHSKRSKDPKVKEEAQEQPGPSDNEAEKEGEAAAAQPDRKRRSNRNRAPAREENGEEEAQKPHNDKDPDPNQNSSRPSTVERLYKLTQGNHVKVMKEHYKIRDLQHDARKQIVNIKKLEDLVIVLDSKINETNDDILHYKMTLA